MITALRPAAIEDLVMSSTSTFAHVVFQTGQLPQTRDWHCSVLDAHVVDEDKAL